MELIIAIIILTAVIAQFVVMVVLSSKNKRGAQDNGRLEKHEQIIRDEFGKNRDEMNKSARESREELANSITNFEKKVSDGLEKIRESVEKKLADIQLGNEKKLDEMRKTVDEKLHQTLETRLTNSFKLVSERLELVQKGLGEMQNLASDVGNLKNVLSNVKNRGTLGEYQLWAILEQILTPAQYAKDVKVNPNSGAMVEFAINIPRKDGTDKPLWLPIDSKFPTSDYEKLIDAYNGGDKNEIDQIMRALKATIIKSAKEINEKYIDPPNTTDFGIMFLPFEGLYAEVLRIPGVFEYIQKEYKVTITGPTTISAFLSSLQMGFKTLAVEKRTSEIWEILGAVKTEFGKFGDVLAKTKQKLDAASKEIENAGTRSRAIEKKLRHVETLPSGDNAQKLFSDLPEVGTDDDSD